MALQTFKPTSPGRRSMVRVVHGRPAQGRPAARRWSRRKPKTGGRNNNGRITTRHNGGGHKQHYRLIDFKRDKEGIAGARRADRVRPEPHRAHRAAVLRRRRAPLHHRAEGPECRRPADVRQGRADQGRQHPAAAQHADRLDRALHRDEAGQGRADRARRRRRRAADRARAAVTPRCAFAPARCARCRPTAARPSAKSATSSTTSRSSARPAPSAGAASGRPCAARR